MQSKKELATDRKTKGLKIKQAGWKSLHKNLWTIMIRMLSGWKA